eukprot:12732231-Alexandrium_andersonii.AAC.1
MGPIRAHGLDPGRRAGPEHPGHGARRDPREGPGSRQGPAVGADSQGQAEGLQRPRARGRPH